MKKFEFKISGETFIIEKNVKALALFEEMQTAPEYNEAHKLSNNLKMFYCILRGRNYIIQNGVYVSTFNYTFDEFIYLLDKFPQAVETFTDYLNSIAGVDKKEKK